MIGVQHVDFMPAAVEFDRQYLLLGRMGRGEGRACSSLSIWLSGSAASEYRTNQLRSGGASSAFNVSHFLMAA